MSTFLKLLIEDFIILRLPTQTSKVYNWVMVPINPLRLMDSNFTIGL